MIADPIMIRMAIGPLPFMNKVIISCGPQNRGSGDEMCVPGDEMQGRFLHTLLYFTEKAFSKVIAIIYKIMYDIGSLRNGNR